MEKLFKDAVAYTPKMLAATHGMTEQYWDYIIRHHLPQMGLPNLNISQSPTSKRQRLAAFGRDLNQWDANRKREARERIMQPAEKQKAAAARKNVCRMPGFNPDGTIMNSRQLREAKEGKKHAAV